MFLPILLAVSPLAATRSAPVQMASTFPQAMREAAAESQIKVEGIFSVTTSYAVNLEPVRTNHWLGRNQKSETFQIFNFREIRSRLFTLTVRPGFIEEAMFQVPLLL